MKYERNYRLRLHSSSPEGRILFRRESRRFQRFYLPPLANHLGLVYVFVLFPRSIFPIIVSFPFSCFSLSLSLSLAVRASH